MKQRKVEDDLYRGLKKETNRIKNVRKLKIS
jgi:hypothetical protein